MDQERPAADHVELGGLGVEDRADPVDRGGGGELVPGRPEHREAPAHRVGAEPGRVREPLHVPGLGQVAVDPGRPIGPGDQQRRLPGIVGLVGPGEQGDAGAVPLATPDDLGGDREGGLDRAPDGVQHRVGNRRGRVLGRQAEINAHGHGSYVAFLWDKTERERNDYPYERDVVACCRPYGGRGPRDPGGPVRPADPCSEYDVRTLLGHLSWVALLFEALARKEPMPPEDNEPDALETRVRGMVEGWSHQEAFEGRAP
nr:hypothetical protein GCM10020093_046370 [Planobispora longispora]